MSTNCKITKYLHTAVTKAVTKKMKVGCCGGGGKVSPVHCFWEWLGVATDEESKRVSSKKLQSKLYPGVYCPN